MENNQPMVACIMLVNGREALAMRAMEAFFAQTYPNRRLVVWDTGEPTFFKLPGDFDSQRVLVPAVPREKFVGASVGALRNAANRYALAHYTTSRTRPEILCHWDSDDYSHPKRLQEQVALLQASRKKAVGYNEVLFWDSRPGQFGGAWLYSNPNAEYFVGASMMYWREAWEQCKFEEGRDTNGRSLPEDARWWNANHKDCLGCSATLGAPELADVCGSRQVIYDHAPLRSLIEPRLICEIHGDNTSTSYRDAVRQSPSWKRAPKLDDHCRKVMAI